MRGIFGLGSAIILLFFLFLFSRMVVSDEIVLTQKTIGGNTIRCYKKGDSGKKILLIGCMHGFEKAGIILSIKILNEIFAKENLANTLLCIPSANPDGNILETRMNANRIDINRNFPSSNWVYVDSAKLKNEKIYFWGGSEAASEIETRFILKVDSIFDPEIIIVFHQFLNLVNYDGRGRALAEYLSNASGLELEEDMGYETPGSMGSYFGIDKNKEIVTIELPENPSDTLQQNLTKAIVDLIEKGY